MKIRRKNWSGRKMKDGSAMTLMMKNSISKDTLNLKRRNK